MSRFTTVTLCVIILAGCASNKGVELPDISEWEQRQAVLGAAQDWEFKGRIAVKAGDDGFNGKLKWRQDGDAFSATVSGPLGIGTVRVSGDTETVILTDKDGLDTVLANPEAELYYRYGWTIPVRSLRYWALGIPDPGYPADTQFDDAGRLDSLQQSNWTVTISRYRESAGQEMPRTLAALNPDTRVRIVIDRWLFFDR